VNDVDIPGYHAIRRKTPMSAPNAKAHTGISPANSPPGNNTSSRGYDIRFIL